MNNPEQPSKPMTIVGAEQYARQLWEATQAEQTEEEPHVEESAPPGSEIVEDEVKALEAVLDADAKRQAREKGKDYQVAFRAHTIWRVKRAPVPLWRVNGCLEILCDEPGCIEAHHKLYRLMISKESDGSYTILDELEEIYDVSEEKENDACYEAEAPNIVPVRLSDLMAEAAKRVVQAQEEAKQAKEEAEEDEGDEELLAKLKEKRCSITRDPDPLEDTAVRLPKIDMDQLCMVEGNEEDQGAIESFAPQLPEYVLVPHRRQGWFWRVWNWLWRRR